MTNPSKAKGTAWETAYARCLIDLGFPYAERRALAGAFDMGDIKPQQTMNVNGRTIYMWTVPVK